MAPSLVRFLAVLGCSLPTIGVSHAVTLDEVKGQTLFCSSTSLNSRDERYTASDPAKRILDKPGAAGLTVHVVDSRTLLVDESCGAPWFYSLPVTIGEENRSVVKLCRDNARSTPHRFSYRAAFAGGVLQIEATSVRHERFDDGLAGIVQRENFRVVFEAGETPRAKLTGYRGLIVITAADPEAENTHRIVETSLPEPVVCTVRSDRPRQPGWFTIGQRS